MEIQEQFCLIAKQYYLLICHDFRYETMYYFIIDVACYYQPWVLSDVCYVITPYTYKLKHMNLVVFIWLSLVGRC